MNRLFSFVFSTRVNTKQIFGKARPSTAVYILCFVGWV